MQYLTFTVRGFVPDPETQQPILILQDETERFALPIWIGLPEAGAIAAALEERSLPRPMTHDLLATVIGTLGATVDHVCVRAIDAGTFLADLWLRDQTGALHSIDCRPSDAIALAVRTGGPIRVAAPVLEAAQPLNAASGDENDTNPLETVSADDPEACARLAETLARLTPEDFGKFRA